MADLNFLVADWPTISRRLDEVLALPVEQRDTWLEGLEEPAALKTTLRRLLADAGGPETGDLLDALPRLTLGPERAGSAGAGDDASAADGATAGLVVGSYRLIRELGVGGMGTVWLAERIDGALKREVALKLPRATWARGLAERMARERDILASLDHPNIARIHDAGLDEQGRPYLALEYVEGEPIGAYCKRLALPVAARLELILQVARAVAHAHARLVVHRDLKPANILVTTAGQVRLLDFGIAKLMEGELTRETALTAMAGRALTLDYASPEQIRGDPIGTASDVYSLGVVAYELLAETRPYQLKRQSAAALEDAIASVDVRLASSAAASPATQRALKGDLDAILNKALKKDVAERYATVEAFAEDIERHLARLPVSARPDGLGYRAWRFVSRNRLAVGAAVTVGLSLVIGLTVALWQTRAALAQADRAERVKDFALSIFEDADIGNGTGTSRTTAADLLKAAKKRVGTELASRPELAVELMTAIGYSLLGQGEADEASALMLDAVTLADQRLGPRHPLTGAARAVYGEALANQGRNKEAISVLAPAIDEARRNGDIHTLIDALRFTSGAQLYEGMLEEGVQSSRQAVAALELPVKAGKALKPVNAFEAYQGLANALSFAGEPGAADAARRALSLSTSIYGSTLAIPVIDARSELARAEANEGQGVEALRDAETIVSDALTVLGPQHPHVADLASKVGSTRVTAGDIAGAIDSFEQAVRVIDAVPAQTAFNRGSIRLGLANAYGSARQPAKSIAVADETVALLKQAGDTGKFLSTRMLLYRAAQLIELGRLDDAERDFATAAVSEPRVAPSTQSRLATLRSLQGRHDEATTLARAAAASLSKAPSLDAQLGSRAILGKVLLDAGDARAALEALITARDGYASAQVRMTPDHADVLTDIGRAHLALGDAAAATKALTVADTYWQGYGPTNRRAALAAMSLAQALWLAGDRAASAAALARADAVPVANTTAADQARLLSIRRSMKS